MAEEQWYFARGGEQQGPVSRAELVARVGRGEIQRSDLVWMEGMAQWEAAGAVKGLLPGATPPPLPAMESIPFARASGPVYAPPADLGQNAGMRMLMPVGRSGWAIAAGYLGLFSFIVFPAPIALIVSIMAIRDLKKHPESHGMGRAVFGLIMGVLGTIAFIFVVISIVASNGR